MADTTADPGTSPGTTPGTPPADPPPDDNDDDAGNGSGTRDDDSSLKAALRKANREAAESRRKLREFEDAQKSELQRAVERAEAAERERDTLRVSVLRSRIGAKFELPAELAEVLVGDDEAEMTEHAKRLAKVVRPPGNVGGGRGGSVPPPGGDDMNALIRARAGR